MSLYVCERPGKKQPCIGCLKRYNKNRSGLEHGSTKALTREDFLPLCTLAKTGTHLGSASRHNSALLEEYLWSKGCCVNENGRFARAISVFIPVISEVSACLFVSDW